MNAKSARAPASSGGRGRRKRRSPNQNLILSRDRVRVRSHCPMVRSGMQYRTPGLTVPMMVPSGQSRTGARGWPGAPQTGALHAPLISLRQRGGTAGVSKRRSRAGGPATKTPAKSAARNTVYIPGAPRLQTIRPRLAHHARAINLASPAFGIDHGFRTTARRNARSRLGTIDGRQGVPGQRSLERRGASVRVPQSHRKHFHRRVLFGAG